MHYETNRSCPIVALVTACRRCDFVHRITRQQALHLNIISMKSVLIFLGAAFILGAAFSVYFDWLHNQTKPVAAQAIAAHTSAKLR
jgi:hypothetical protein